MFAVLVRCNVGLGEEGPRRAGGERRVQCGERGRIGPEERGGRRTATKSWMEVGRGQRERMRGGGRHRSDWGPLASREQR